MAERLSGVDPSQIAGTPEWKARVQAEAAGRLLGGIHGIGQVDERIDIHAAGVGEPRRGDVRVETISANQPLHGRGDRSTASLPVDDNPGRDSTRR